MIDQNPNTAWSSVGHLTEEMAEQFVFWFAKHRVNFLELTPRRHNGKAYCFPKRIVIYYSAGPLDWQLVREVNLADPGENLDSVMVSLDRTIETDGFLVRASHLRTDNFGNNYYFQMAGARACYRTLEFDVDYAKSSAEQFPSSLFFFGDEPDSSLPADEYARVYQQFVDAIKSGSPTARVSPAGFTFDNRIYGSKLTDYAQKFFDSNNASIDEWRFHYFSSDPNCYDNIYAPLADWCAQHGGLSLVLGSFGMPGTPQDTDITLALQTQMKQIKSDDRIAEAVYWSYNFTEYGNHLLVNGDALSHDGETFRSNM